MSSVTRWLMLSYGIAGLIAAYLLSNILEGVFSLIDFEDPLVEWVPITTLVSLIVGIVTFVILAKHKRTNEFGNDVIKEIKKVTWPTFIETRASTIVVIVLVLIVSMILGLFDYIFASLTSLIYS